MLIAYNDSTTGRTPLSLAISENGMGFVKVRDLRTEAGSYAYPTLLLSHDGLFHLTYTFNGSSIAYEVFSLKDLNIPAKIEPLSYQ